MNIRKSLFTPYVICIWLLVYCIFTSTIFAQYRCDWNSFNAGGYLMSSSDFQVNVSISQSAIGDLTGTNYHSFIGFWQIDTTLVGIEENFLKSNSLNQLITELKPARPNPFSKTTNISYSLAKQSDVDLTVYNTCGQMVKRFFIAKQKPGIYSFTFSATDEENRPLTKGVYFYRFSTEDYQQVKKLLLIK
jgi:hypothetical protein